MFTQYKLDPEHILTMLEGSRAAYASFAPGGDFAQHAAMVIAARLREHPEAYLEFGPYWWAVKDSLRAQGYDFGSADDPAVRPHYTPQPLETPGLALVAGELFKDFYRRTFLVGAAQYWLDEGAEESYVLFDPNMEARRLGPGALAVAANLDAQPEADEPAPKPETEKPRVAPVRRDPIL